MRRVTGSGDSERGGISVVVAILMVVLLGFTALAVDVGILASERVQLQNGADAAALLVAQKCANSESDADCSTTSPLAASTANQNALDGASNIHSITLDKQDRVVTVTAGAKQTGEQLNTLSLVFAKALGISSAEVLARSSVKWGSASKGPSILPLAVAECKFNLAPGTPAGIEIVLEQAVGGCGGIPGGFGWLTDNTDTLCSVTLTTGSSSDPGVWVESDTGASMPSVCKASDLAKLRDQTVLLPLYAVATGTGSGGKYYIKGFAAFHVTGYHFADQNWSLSGSTCNKCIKGRFEKFVSLTAGYGLGPVDSYGTTIVQFG